MLNLNDVDYFFTHQITAKNEAYKKYQQTSMRDLLCQNEAFRCEVISIRENQQIIAQFETASSPRDRSYWCALYIPEAETSKPFSHLLNHQATGYTDFSVIRRWKTGEYKTLIICEVQDCDFFLAIKKAIENQKFPTLWIAECRPPVLDLLNTQKFMYSYSASELTSIFQAGGTWDPTPISSVSLREELAETTSALSVVQGPPGTGKSYLAAELISLALKQKKSVAVVAMSNRALMEVALKPALREHLELGHVSKTALSSREKRECSKLLAAQELRPNASHLLLMTVYQATKLFLNQVQFDLLILDEASQVFLPMILGLKKISRQLFIIGDPAQLPPITEVHPSYGEIPADYHPLITGLDTIARSVSRSHQFILNETYRLLPSAAALTSVFYPTKLKSLRPPYLNEQIQSIHYNQGCEVLDLDNGESILKKIEELIGEYLDRHPKGTIAIISPLIKDVSRLQQRMSDISPKRLLIETVDRIQGLTVDFCLFVIFEENEFVYDLNRFNVATSRSRGLTLILRCQSHVLETRKPLKVERYLELIGDVP